MTNANIERLRAIKTLAQLAAYLRDELDWPIEPGDTENITFDYDASELGIDEKAAVRIKEIKQLRPLTGNQPWGIFFVNFEKKRLPVVVMRKILRSLVFKKREAANKADRQAWQPSDLLFISAYGEDTDRAITFAHFVEDASAGGAAELRVLGWDDDDTPLKYDYVAHVLHEKLRWQGEFERDKEAWRKNWREAFVLRHREVISTSKELALALSAAAKKIRGRVRSILRYEDSSGEMRKLQRAFQQALIHDLNDDDFADMLAQTVTYGLFSVSVRRTFPGGGTAVTREDAQHLIFTSPFLKEMMNTFLGVKSRKGKIDFDELGIADVTDLLQSADTHMEAVLRDFGNRTRDEDPVIHFYELFLHDYDKQLKIQRGVFYTPQPVVSYIVRSVHELLQTEFGLADGLADTTTWGDMLKKHPGLKLPPLTDEPGETRAISPDEPFVQILDPATGTATFLVEVIDVIHRTLAAKWKQQRLTDAQQRAAWNDYVPQHLLPRLHAFELMMAPYAIAHMKIGLKLAETGYRFGTEERARIYLTNALEPWLKQLPLIGFDALAHEAAAVNEIKRHKRFTVVIGNPPYAGDSANASRDDNGNLTFIGRLIEDYKQVDGQPLGERQPKWLQDDYVKFIRFAEHLASATGVGILGYITNHSYLDNPTFRGMRQHIMALLSHLWTLDLHGNTTKKETPPPGIDDVNVFEIQQGVAILVGLSKGGRNPQGRVDSAEIWGNREKKYNTLGKSSLLNTQWERLAPTTPFYLLVPQNVDLRTEYEQAWSIKKVMPTFNVGFVTARDEFVVDFEPSSIRERIQLFRKSEKEMPTTEIRKRFGLKDTTSWNLKDAREALRRDAKWDKWLMRCLYRAFDIRFICYSRDLLERPVFQIQRHLLDGDNLALLVSRQVVDSFRHVFVTDMIANFNTLATAGRLGSGPVFPLYLTGDRDMQELVGLHSKRIANLGADFLKELARGLALKPNSSHGLPEGVTPEDIFHYAYGVFHSPGYRSRYAEFLKIDFPRLPLTGNLELFRALARLGGELVALHLLESSKVNHPITGFIGGRNPTVEKVSWSNNTVWIDKSLTVGFKDVPENVWDFHIGGYQVCEKWLKDRKGRTLTKDDIAHYHKIVVALSETIRLMKEIDEVIEAHGGWPDAFKLQGST